MLLNTRGTSKLHVNQYYVVIIQWLNVFDFSQFPFLLGYPLLQYKGRDDNGESDWE